MIVATLYDWLLFGHILGAIVWLGGIAVLIALLVRALRAPGAAAAVDFVASLRTVGPIVLAPSSLLVLVCGIWLAADLSAFNQLWVQLGLGLFAAAFVVGAAHQSRVGLAAERAVEAGTTTRLPDFSSAGPGEWA